MQLPRIVVLGVSLAASAALALPAAAQPPAHVTDRMERTPGNPVAHCLPDRADEDEESEEPVEEPADETTEDDTTDDEPIDEPTGDDSTEDDATEGEESEEPVEEPADETTEDDATDDEAVATAAAEEEPTEEPVGDEPADDEPAEGETSEEESTDEETSEEESDDEESDEDADADDGERGAVAQCVLDSLPDIVGNAHASSIVALVVNGVANGKADGTFAPDEDVTRAQMATFLSNALDLEPSADAELPDDVQADHPHADGIAAIIEQGIARGDGDGNYAPAKAVSRGQMATFLDQALELADQADFELPEDATGNVHEKAIEAVMGNGIAKGFTDGTFRPDADVSRGQMASFITQGLNL